MSCGFFEKYALSYTFIYDVLHYTTKPITGSHSLITKWYEVHHKSCIEIMKSEVQNVQCIMQVVLLVDGGTMMTALIFYNHRYKLNTVIQHTLIAMHPSFH